jgi:hypothetical protein
MTSGAQSVPSQRLLVGQNNALHLIKTLNGAPPSTTFTDTNVKNNTTILIL